MLNVYRELVILLLTVGLTTMSNTHPILRRMLVIGLIAFASLVLIESKLRKQSPIHTVRRYLVPIGMSLLFHGVLLCLQDLGTPLEVAMYSVIGWVVIMVYAFTIPFNN